MVGGCADTEATRILDPPSLRGVSPNCGRESDEGKLGGTADILAALPIAALWLLAAAVAGVVVVVGVLLFPIEVKCRLARQMF